MTGALLAYPMFRGETINAGPSRIEYTSSRAWPKRQPAWIEQAHYWEGETPFCLLQTPGQPNVVKVQTPLFTDHPEAGAELPGYAVPIVRRPGDQVEVNVGAVDPTIVPATAIRLEMFGSSYVTGPFYYVRPPLDLTAAQALDGGYGVGTILEGGPKYWYARLRFVGLVALPAGGPRCRWWVSA